MKDLVYYVHSNALSVIVVFEGIDFTISVVLGFMIMVGIEIGEKLPYS